MSSPRASIIITATAVGAPGFAKPSIAPRDCIDSAQPPDRFARRAAGRRDLRPRAGLQRVAGRRCARPSLRRCCIERPRSSDREDGRHGPRVAPRRVHHPGRLRRPSVGRIAPDRRGRRQHRAHLDGDAPGRRRQRRPDLRGARSADGGLRETERRRRRDHVSDRARPRHAEAQKDRTVSAHRRLPREASC